MTTKDGMEILEEDELVSPEIQKAVDDAQKLIAFIAWNGNVELDESLIANLIDAKYKIAAGHWNSELESKFWMHYDELAKMVYPVTIQSLNATMPVFGGQLENKIKQRKTKADKAVAGYRFFTMLALIILLATQIYWIVGSNLNNNLKKLFQQQEEIQFKIAEISVLNQVPDQTGKGSALTLPQIQLENKMVLLNQQLDANYELLRSWNRVWMFGGRFEGKLPDYEDFETEFYKKKYEKNAAKLKEVRMKAELDKARNKMFLNMLSAEFVLEAFQGYVLPLLYGLLGAFIFVLRTLAREVKSLTYSFDSEISYRLRLTLGSLSGMIVGWFLKADMDSMIVSLSPMALAFLMGYNVDILFSIMDRFIMNITKWVQQQAINRTAEPQTMQPEDSKLTQPEGTKSVQAEKTAIPKAEDSKKQPIQGKKS